MEVGPLARMVVAYFSGGTDSAQVRVKALVDRVLGALGVGPSALVSTLGRVAARGIETQVIAEKMSELSLKMSMRQVGLQELLALSELSGTLPSRIVVWGMQPASLEWGLDLSPLVTAQLDNLVCSVARELCGWGVAIDHGHFNAALL